MTDAKTGILLLSHGSRLDDGEEVIKAYKEMYAEEFPDMPVEYGFMEIRKPGIPETIKKLSEEDVDRIIVVPVFVAHGLHTKRDIPGLLGIESDYEGESGHHDHHHGHHHHHHHDHDEEPVEFDGEIILTDPLGVDKRMYEIIKDRVSEHL